MRKILSESGSDHFDSEDTETELNKQEDLLDGIVHHSKWEKMSLLLTSGQEVHDWLKDTSKSSFLVLSGLNGNQHGQVNAAYSWLTQAISTQRGCF